MGRKSNVVKQKEIAAADAQVESEVEKRLNERLAKFEADIAAKYATPAPRNVAAVVPMDVEWARTLATSIAELTGQGVGRERHTPPEVLEARDNARKLMMERIVSAKKEGRAASYEVTNKTQLAHQVIEPFWVDSAHAQRPTVVDWDGVPNEVLKPVNDTAKEIHSAFLASIGSVPKVVPDDPVGTTMGGLVVRGQGIPTQRRTDEVGGASAPGDAARVHNRTQATRVVETRILGSLAEPARQTN